VDAAIEQFREAINADPKYTASYNNLAQSLVKQGKLEEAMSYYETSLSVKPSAAVHNKLGVVLMTLGRIDEAKDQFRGALALDPGYTEARNNLAAIR
ncbi:MAG: tetratricopeptide repeat protein, partial [Candidatus Binatia bacterium]